MKKNNVGGILIVTILISFICGAIGGFFLLNSFDSNDEKSTITLTHSGVTLTEEDSISKGVEAIYDATVVIQTFRDGQGEDTTGTGFIYKKTDKKAYIITNHHVVENPVSLSVILSDGTVLEAVLKGSETYSDIAVLEIDASKVKSVAIIGDSSKVNVGDTVFTVGAPNGADYAGTVTKGVLSGKDRLVPVALSGTEQIDYYMEVMQTDAAINPGNSGGPICNINGEVIGVTGLKLVSEEVERMGFATSIEDALFFAETLEKGQKVVRPVLGVGMCDVTDTTRLFVNQVILDKDITEGVVVLEVTKGSAAGEAKLKKGDVIIELDGVKTSNSAWLRTELYKHTPGETVEIKYIRNGKKKTADVKLLDNSQE